MKKCLALLWLSFSVTTYTNNKFLTHYCNKLISLSSIFYKKTTGECDSLDDALKKKNKSATLKFLDNGEKLSTYERKKLFLLLMIEQEHQEFESNSFIQEILKNKELIMDEYAYISLKGVTKRVTPLVYAAYKGNIKAVMAMSNDFKNKYQNEAKYY